MPRDTKIPDLYRVNFTHTKQRGDIIKLSYGRYVVNGRIGYGAGGIRGLINEHLDGNQGQCRQCGTQAK